MLTLIWIVGLTNAFNLLDNMDGLCAGIARHRRRGAAGRRALPVTAGSPAFHQVRYLAAADRRDCSASSSTTCTRRQHLHGRQRQPAASAFSLAGLTLTLASTITGGRPNVAVDRRRAGARAADPDLRHDARHAVAHGCRAGRRRWAAAITRPIAWSRSGCRNARRSTLLWLLAARRRRDRRRVPESRQRGGRSSPRCSLVGHDDVRRSISAASASTRRRTPRRSSAERVDADRRRLSMRSGASPRCCSISSSSTVSYYAAYRLKFDFIEFAAQLQLLHAIAAGRASRAAGRRSSLVGVYQRRVATFQRDRTRSLVVPRRARRRRVCPR